MFFGTSEASSIRTAHFQCIMGVGGGGYAKTLSLGENIGRIDIKGNYIFMFHSKDMAISVINCDTLMMPHWHIHV